MNFSFITNSSGERVFLHCKFSPDFKTFTITDIKEGKSDIEWAGAEIDWSSLKKYLPIVFKKWNQKRIAAEWKKLAVAAKGFTITEGKIKTSGKYTIDSLRDFFFAKRGKIIFPASDDEYLKYLEQKKKTYPRIFSSDGIMGDYAFYYVYSLYARKKKFELNQEEQREFVKQVDNFFKKMIKKLNVKLENE